MKSFLALFILVYFHLSALAQPATELMFNKADSLFGLGLYSESYGVYDSILNEIQGTHVLIHRIRALTGKGKSLRYDHPARPQESLVYFGQARLLAVNSKEIAEKEVAQIAYHQGTTERELGNYDRALNYINFALLQAKGGGNIEFLARCYSALANVYNDQDRCDEAEYNYKKAISLIRSLGVEKEHKLAIYLMNQAANYQMCEEYEQSNLVLDQLSVLNKKDNSDSARSTFFNAFLYLLNYQGLGDTSGMKRYYNMMIPFIENLEDEIEIESLESYWYIGKTYSILNDFENALRYYQKAMMACIDGFASEDPLISPHITEAPLDSQVVALETVYQLLQDKGAAMTKLYEQTGKIDYLDVVRKTYDIADEIIMRQRFEMNEDGASLHLAEHAHSIQELALENLYEIYEKSWDKEILDDAFRYIERNKQVILLRNKLINERLGYDNKFLKEMTSAQFEIDQLQRSVDGSILDNDNPQAIITLLGDIIEKHLSKKMISDSISMDNVLPVMKNVRLDVVKEVLPKGKLMLSYFWGERSIFVLAVSEGITIFEKIPTQDLSGDIDDFLLSFIDVTLTSLSSNFESYTKTAWKLYQELIEPFVVAAESKGEVDELLIIPDGRINTISFAALLLDDHRGIEGEYEDLNYLMSQYNVGYSFSASNLLSDLKRNRDGASILAFSNTSLIGSEDEIEKIFSDWEGDKLAYLKEEATEDNFKKEVSKYDIIHLATHGTAGIGEAESSLYFYKDATSESDSRLYNYEIYPLRIDARLVTLSSCESGLGEDMIGEGVYSLARGFSFAGSPSIIMSLWKVSDVKTSEIMPLFYENLQRGRTISNALREGQLSYLAGAKGLHAHPVNWAGFVAIGDGDQVIFDPGFALVENYAIVFLLLFAMITFLIYLKFRI